MVRQRLRIFIATWLGFVALMMVFVVIQMLPAFYEARYDVRMPVCLQVAESGRGEAFLEDAMRGAGVEHWAVAAAGQPLAGCDGYRQRVLEFNLLVSHRAASALFEHIREAGPDAGVYSRGLSYQTSPAGTGTVPYAVSVFAAALLALGFWWCVRRRGTGTGSDGAATIGIRGMVVGAVSATGVALVAAIAYGFILQVTGVIHMPEQSNVETVTPLLLLTAAVFAPVVEEVIFRFWLLDRMIPVIGPVAALVLSSLVFSMIHMDLEPFALGSRLITGLVLGLLWLRTSSLGACVLAHGLFNAAVLALDQLAGTTG